ncbi:MAG: alpha/beta fold hydrolase [Streptosporangiaceae bacterium]
MPVLDRWGTRLYYEVREPSVRGRAASDSALLLTHGFATTSLMWRGNLEALARRRQVITWDMRGHGRSDSPRDPAEYAETVAVDDMVSILDACGVGKAVGGGLSLGGYLSLAFTLAHPERVLALLLFDTGPGFKKDEARHRWNVRAAARADAFAERGLAALPDSPEVALADHRDAGGLAAAARGVLTQFDAHVISSLPEIRVPTLVVVGERDTAFLAAADYMTAKIPHAAKVVIDDAGHAPNVEQPETFNRVVDEFLSRLPEATRP